MTRYKAFTLHLLSSIVVLSFLYLLVERVWYPGKLFNLAAGIDLLGLIAIVDLVLGPLVMLIIFDAKKKYIKLDVFIVVLCQFGFMIYGCWSMFSARPAYFAFVDNHFYLVKANEIDEDSLKRARNPQFKQIPLTGPVPVGTQEPDDLRIRNEIALSSIGGMGIQDLPRYFVPYSQVRQQVMATGKLSKDLTVDQSTKARVFAYEKIHATKEVILFIPMVNKLTPLIVAIDPKTAQILAII